MALRVYGLSKPMFLRRMRGRSTAAQLLLLGATCLIVLVLRHVAEALHHAGPDVVFETCHRPRENAR
jgi:hypothetical protein